MSPLQHLSLPLVVKNDFPAYFPWHFAQEQKKGTGRGGEFGLNFAPIGSARDEILAQPMWVCSIWDSRSTPRMCFAVVEQLA